MASSLAPQHAVALSVGISCEDSLTWLGGTWRPGGEFVRELRLRNTTTRTLHVRYALPATKVFSMAFPEPLALPPGITETLEVRFRPLQWAEQRDVVALHVGGTTFEEAAKVADINAGRLQIGAPAGGASGAAGGAGGAPATPRFRVVLGGSHVLSAKGFLAELQRLSTPHVSVHVGGGGGGGETLTSADSRRYSRFRNDGSNSTLRAN